MKYNLAWLINQIDNDLPVKYIHFWGHQPEQNGYITSSCFSQWWRAPFVCDGLTYPTAEHWMMAQKAQLFDNQDIFEKILAARSPAEAKELGRQVLNFDEEIWCKKRVDIVVRGSLLKFEQNIELKEFLLNTKNRILVEASPVDQIWGIGLAANDPRATNPLQWNGLNLLGFALMEVRGQLSGNWL